MTMASRRSASWVRRRWLVVGAGLGFTSALAQVLLLRELLVGFRGNELSLGISLAAWLMSVALGSAVAGRLSRARPAEDAPGPAPRSGGPGRRSRSDLAARAPAIALLFLGILPLVGIWLARDLRHFLGIGWGEFIPASQLVHATAMLIAPVGFAAGAAFPLICRAAEVHAGVKPGAIYLAESLGFLAGGVATFATADVLAPFGAALATAAAAGAFALLAAWDSRGLRYGAVAWAAAASAALAVGAPAQLETGSLANLFPGQRIVASEYSRYGTWVALSHGEQVSFYHNGALAFSAPNRIAAETLAHLTLLQHRDPRRVLLIGGGVDGTATEILKHRRVRLDYVELDPAIIPLARACSRRAAPRLDQLLAHPRLRFSQCDGRLFVKRAAAARAGYDVIMVNLPEPATALLNRFYTLEFFSEAKRALGPDGVLCVGIPGAENYIGPEMQALHGSVYHALRRVFADVVMTPGEHTLFFASARAGFLTVDAAALAQRWAAREVPASYFSSYYLDAILLPERVDFIRRSCESAPRAINRDFRPVGYFYDVAVAGLAEGILPPGALGRTRALPVPLLALCGLALFAVPFALSPRGERVRRCSLVGGIAAAGFAGMTLELCLLFGLQVLNGHVYSQVGALVAVFMAGLAAGTWAEGRALAAGRRPRQRWLAWLAGGAALCAATPVLLATLAANPSAGGWPSGLVIGALMAAGGAMVGALFPLGVRMLGDSARAAGTIYAADVAGAAVGALVVAVIALPVLGLAGTCYTAALILAAGAVISFAAGAVRRADP